MRNLNMPHSNYSLANRVGFVLASASLIAGAAAMSILPANAEAKVQDSSAQGVAPLPDGVYLYGQSDSPNEVGKGYFVFESKKGEVVGALYMPFSSFDCASGNFKENQLALTVVNSYDRTTNPFQIAVERQSTVASNGAPIVNVGLDGFKRLDKLSEADQRYLNTCKADLQSKAVQ